MVALGGPAGRRARDLPRRHCRATHVATVVGVTRPEPLPDTWYTRDFLVLREVGRRVEAGEPLGVDDIATALGLARDVVGKAGSRLKEEGYLKAGEAMGIGAVRFFDLTAKGRREVGQWPSAETAADRLIAVLEQRIMSAPNDEERTRWQKLRDGFLGAGRDVVVDITSAVLTGQIT